MKFCEPFRLVHECISISLMSAVQKSGSIPNTRRPVEISKTHKSNSGDSNR